MRFVSLVAGNLELDRKFQTFLVVVIHVLELVVIVVNKMSTFELVYIQARIYERFWLRGKLLK